MNKNCKYFPFSISVLIMKNKMQGKINYQIHKCTYFVTMYLLVTMTTYRLDVRTQRGYNIKCLKI